MVLGRDLLGEHCLELRIQGVNSIPGGSETIEDDQLSIEVAHQALARRGGLRLRAGLLLSRGRAINRRMVNLVSCLLGGPVIALRLQFGWALRVASGTRGRPRGLADDSRAAGLRLRGRRRSRRSLHLVSSLESRRGWDTRRRQGRGPAANRDRPVDRESSSDHSRDRQHHQQPMPERAPRQTRATIKAMVEIVVMFTMAARTRSHGQRWHSTVGGIPPINRIFQ